MRRKGRKVEVLEQVRLFSACTKKELVKIASLADEVEAKAGDLLTREGETGREFFVIAEGQAKVSRHGRKVGTLGRGGFFGEMALLDQGPRSATVTAETAMTIFVLDARAFATLGRAASSRRAFLHALSPRRARARHAARLPCGMKSAMVARGVAARVERLRSIPLFADLTQTALRRIAATIAQFEVPRGQVLVQPKTEATGMFLIEEGTALVELRGGRRFELGPGEFVGELALLNTGAVRNARVRAETDMVCLAIRRDQFLKLLESEPKIAVAMLRTLARRLTEADEQISRGR